MRNETLVGLVGLAVLALTVLPPNFAAQAQSGPSTTRAAALAASTDLLAQQQVRRHATRIRIIGHALPPTATRTCSSWYEQEYRPSGTVVVPRMRCHWING